MEADNQNEEDTSCFDFEIEEYHGQYSNFLGQPEPLTEEIFARMSAASRKKFVFPKIDPAENQYVDARTPKQIARDIERIMSLALTKDEAEIWSSIAERDIVCDIHLKNGIRTPKQVITNAIKEYRKKHNFCPLPLPHQTQPTPPHHAENNSNDADTTMPSPILHTNEQKTILQSPQPTPPMPNMTAQGESDSLSESEPAVAQTNAAKTANGDYCQQKLSESENHGRLQANLTKTQERYRGDLAKDPAPQPARNDREEILQELHKNREYLQGLLNEPDSKISTIFRKHRQLFHTFISLYHRLINDQMSRRFQRYVNQRRKISFRLIKKMVRFMCRNEILQNNNSHFVNIFVNLSNKSPTLNININGQSLPAILDSGSGYTLIPNQYWEKLGIAASQLDTTVRYNISSATHRTRDSVKGRMILNVEIENSDGTKQIVPHHFLVLRPEFSLEVILLGDDFLRATDSSLKYSKGDTIPTVTINGRQIVLRNDIPSFNLTFNSFVAPKKSTNDYQNDTQTMPSL